MFEIATKPGAKYSSRLRGCKHKIQYVFVNKLMGKNNGLVSHYGCSIAWFGEEWKGEIQIYIVFNPLLP